VWSRKLLPDFVSGSAIKKSLLFSGEQQAENEKDICKTGVEEIVEDSIHSCGIPQLSKTFNSRIVYVPG